MESFIFFFWFLLYYPIFLFEISSDYINPRIMLQTKSINWKCFVSLSAASRHGGLGGLVPFSSMATITNSHDAANHEQRHKHHV